jgi:hypothetical protein
VFTDSAKIYDFLSMSFYRDCFGGELNLTKLGDTPMKAQMPETWHRKIAYAHLKSNTVGFSAGADPKLLDELRGLPFGIYGHLADKYGSTGSLTGRNNRGPFGGPLPHFFPNLA